MRLMRTSGVWPMASRMVSQIGWLGHEAIIGRAPTTGLPPETSASAESPHREPERDVRRQAAEAVADAAPEVDRRRVGRVARRARDLADRARRAQAISASTWWSNTKSSELASSGSCRSSAARTRGSRCGIPRASSRAAVPASVSTRFGDVPPERHAARTGRAAENARGQRAVVQAARDHPDHRRQEPRRVLVVGMNHHDDVGAMIEREPVARLLVGAVAAVLRVRRARPPSRAAARAPASRPGSRRRPRSRDRRRRAR